MPWDTGKAVGWFGPAPTDPALQEGPALQEKAAQKAQGAARYRMKARDFFCQMGREHREREQLQAAHAEITFSVRQVWLHSDVNYNIYFTYF